MEADRPLYESPGYSVTRSSFSLLNFLRAFEKLSVLMSRSWHNEIIQKIDVTC